MRLSSGLLFLTLFIFFTSCKKNDSDSTPTGEYYYQATIDGVQYGVNIPANNTDVNLEAGSSLGGSQDVVISANIDNNAPNGTSLAVSKGLMIDYPNASNSDFRNFFSPGPYNFATFGDNGITIGWADPSRTVWSTDAGIGDQTGSSVSIISIIDEPDLFGTLYIKTKVEFNCKLYDGAGNVKQASGTFVGLFGKI